MILTVKKIEFFIIKMIFFFITTNKTLYYHLSFVIFLFIMNTYFLSMNVLYGITCLSCCIYEQKLRKVQLGLQEEETNLNDLKDRYAAAVGEHKRCYSLMKAFQVCFSCLLYYMATLVVEWF